MASFGSQYTSFSTLSPETAPAAEKVRRHPKYYLNGGDTHFLVSFISPSVAWCAAQLWATVAAWWSCGIRKSALIEIHFRRRVADRCPCLSRSRTTFSVYIATSSSASRKYSARDWASRRLPDRIPRDPQTQIPFPSTTSEKKISRDSYGCSTIRTS